MAKEKIPIIKTLIRLTTVLVVGFGFGATARAACSAEQTARMIRYEIDSETIDRLCAQPAVADSSTDVADRLIAILESRDSEDTDPLPTPQSPDPQSRPEQRQAVIFGYSPSLPFFGLSVAYDRRFDERSFLRFRFDQDAVRAASDTATVQYHYVRRFLGAAYLRPFTAESRFYYSLGGGLAQNFMQYRHTILAKEVRAQGNGIVMTASLGWRIGGRFFFQLDCQSASYLIYMDDYEEEDIPQITNHRFIAAKGWEASKNPNRILLHLGFRF
jgi:hypothetical protein